jgi:hypothetical protein
VASARSASRARAAGKYPPVHGGHRCSGPPVSPASCRAVHARVRGAAVDGAARVPQLRAAEPPNEVIAYATANSPTGTFTYKGTSCAVAHRSTRTRRTSGR